MKFTNGYWLNREGVSLYGAVDLRDIKISKDIIIVYVAPFKVFNRGQTLSGPLLTIEISSPRENVLSIHAYHFKGGIKKTPEFDIYTEKQQLTAIENENTVTVSSGNTKAVITKDPFSICYYYKDRLLTTSDTKQLAFIEDSSGVAKQPFFRERLSLGVGECIYGCGERFGAFVKNGQTIDIWNEDGGTASEQSYKNVPFYVSNRSYGVFVNHTEKVSFEIGSEAVSKTQFSVPGQELNYFIIGGDDLKEVIANYTDLLGKPALPPAWSFGLWLSTSFTTEYNEETVNHFINGMLERDLPLSVFHFDCFWMKEYEWCNFNFDEAQFPDIANTLAKIKNKGLKICVWINPYIGQKSPLFDEGMENGYLIKNQQGDVWQWDLWQPGMALVDFTNPNAVKWYTSYLRKLLAMGVDCFKTDFGERIPTNAVYHDGSDPYKMHNFYTQLYNKAVFELLEEVKGKQNAVLFARSATAGGQKYPVHWGGDCYATYESMAESLRGGLSLSLCGFGFWSHDIGGFEATATADVYKRWLAFGLFSTHSRLHGSSSYRVPWLFDEEAVNVLRHFTKLKMKLMPYLFANAAETTKTGVPVMRPMALEYPNDTACAYLDKQYMLGTGILVAPVLDKDGISEAYIPEGRFTHLLTNESIEGGKFLKRKFDYFNLHAWVKPNSIITMGSSDKTPDYDYTKDLEIHVYEPQDATAVIVDINAVKKAVVSAKVQGNIVRVSVEGDVTVKKVIVHIDGNQSEITVAADEKEFKFDREVFA